MARSTWSFWGNFIVPQTWDSGTPSVLSMMINSAPTGCDFACEFHEWTRGAGVSRIFLASQISRVSKTRSWWNLGWTYKVHRGDLTCRSKVWNASIRVRHLSYNFSAIVHRQEECFVEHAVGVLLDRNALSGADRVCRDFCKLIQVESDLSPSKILRLIYNKAATREFEEFIVGIPVWYGWVIR